jgi:ferredoxin
MTKKYDNLVMIYYSGTGNSKRVSEWICHSAMEKGLKVYLTSFNQFDPIAISGLTGNTLIGFFSATHGFNMPHSMLAFLFRFKELKGSDVFIGNTRAGIKLWKLFLPGLSGIALYFPALILLFKGYTIKAMYPVDLPSNWISIHPGLRKKVVDSMVTRYKRLASWFADEVLTGKPVFIKSFILLPLDILVAPIAIAYYFVGRFVIAKTFVANFNCNNCGICAEQCPTHSIIIYKDRPYWKFTCESCMHCMNYCPKRAIETAHSFVFLLIAAIIVFVNPLLHKVIGSLVESWLNGSHFAYESIYFIIHSSITIFTFWAGYKLLHYLMRFPRINRFITYTTFSKWAFWRRYHIPKESH